VGTCLYKSFVAYMWGGKCTWNDMAQTNNKLIEMSCSVNPWRVSKPQGQWSVSDRLTTLFKKVIGLWGPDMPKTKWLKFNGTQHF